MPSSRIIIACMLISHVGLLLILGKGYSLWISSKENVEIGEQPDHWPDLELMLPLHILGFREFNEVFARSFKFFWPKDRQKVVIIVDSEKVKTKDEEKIINALKSPQARISYNEPSRYYARGWDRQQLVMFWADNFTDAEYVGFVDSDAMFITPVDLDDLFEDGKPVIIGGMYKEELEQGTFWQEVPLNIANFIGYTSFIRCMTYFPVIVRVEHLKELRTHVEGIHKVSFNEAFAKMSKGGPYSQFGAMCTFLWNRHRTEYSWHLQQTQDEGVWQLVPERSPRARWAWSLGVTAPMLVPKPRITVHTNYMAIRRPNEALYRYVLFAGYCLDEKLRNKQLTECKKFKQNAVQKQFFCFEQHDWTYHEKTAEAFRRRQERRRHLTHVWDQHMVDYLTRRTRGDFLPNYNSC